jgi:hypothetical protein
MSSPSSPRLSHEFPPPTLPSVFHSSLLFGEARDES